MFSRIVDTAAERISTITSGRVSDRSTLTIPVSGPVEPFIPGGQVSNHRSLGRHRGEGVRGRRGREHPHAQPGDTTARHAAARVTDARIFPAQRILEPAATQEVMASAEQSADAGPRARPVF
jgi:hypothetical protein